MAFVDDREDINSICLSAVQRLLDNYGIDPKSIGRVEVGTESLVDKSKATKTVLMKLFEEAGNHDIEGATVMNACYGGTAALFNSAAWVESSEWDGRYALFVAADIAVYEAGPARPTGGCGAVACLIGPDAPLRLVPKTRSTHSVNVYDFYKPQLSSEYPAVDGALSQVCYIKAVDDCYNGTLDKLEKKGAGASGTRGTHLNVETAFDYMAFHSPYNKLVQQSFRRLLFNDARRLKAAGMALPAHLAGLDKYTNMAEAETLTNRDLEKALQAVKSDAYARMVGPSEGYSKVREMGGGDGATISMKHGTQLQSPLNLYRRIPPFPTLPQNIGNSYTAALYTNLASLVDATDLTGKRVGAFSYGSGAIATMFALDGVAVPAGSAFSLAHIKNAVKLQERLAARRDATPDEFLAALKLREASYGKVRGGRRACVREGV